MSGEFNGWIEGLKFYGPVLLLGFVLLVFMRNTGYWWAPIFVIAIGVCVALFFRDFPRTIPAGEDVIVSPADGTVVDIVSLEDSPYYEGPCTRISIFLSVFNAHVNRAPYEGTVTKVEYKEGAYRDARDPESSKVNESNAVYFDTPRGAMTVRQISGAVARRIVCPVKSGEVFSKGEKFGMIRFGSRTELFVPQGTEVEVALQGKVYAGSSVIARFQEN